MDKRRVGRPKKNNAVKPGQMKKGERRFTFITTNEIVDEIKRGANEEDLTIRDYLNKILHHYWDRNLNKNEKLMKQFSRQHILKN